MLGWIGLDWIENEVDIVAAYSVAVAFKRGSLCGFVCGLAEVELVLFLRSTWLSIGICMGIEVAPRFFRQFGIFKLFVKLFWLVSLFLFIRRGILLSI